MSQTPDQDADAVKVRSRNRAITIIVILNRHPNEGVIVKSHFEKRLVAYKMMGLAVLRPPASARILVLNQAEICQLALEGSVL
jgi:hypothetical protein